MNFLTNMAAGLPEGGLFFGLNSLNFIGSKLMYEDKIAFSLFLTAGCGDGTAELPCY